MISIECERLERRFAGYPLDHVARTDLALYVRPTEFPTPPVDLTGSNAVARRHYPRPSTSMSRPIATTRPTRSVDAPDPLYVSEAAE